MAACLECKSEPRTICSQTSSEINPLLTSFPEIGKGLFLNATVSLSVSSLIDLTSGEVKDAMVLASTPSVRYQRPRIAYRRENCTGVARDDGSHRACAACSNPTHPVNPLNLLT